MKTLITTALASAVYAVVHISPALAVTAAQTRSAGPQATLVFEGTVPSVSPSGGHTITGPGGASLAKGTLTITSAGKVSTSVPVVFEVRDFTVVSSESGESTETIGPTAKPNYKVTLLNSTLTAGAAEVKNDQNVVTVNGTILTPNVVSNTFTQAQASVTFVNNAGFDISKVGSGGLVQANVNIMIEPPTATPPTPDSGT